MDEKQSYVQILPAGTSESALIENRPSRLDTTLHKAIVGDLAKDYKIVRIVGYIMKYRFNEAGIPSSTIYPQLFPPNDCNAIIFTGSRVQCVYERDRLTGNLPEPKKKVKPSKTSLAEIRKILDKEEKTLEDGDNTN